MRTILAIDPGNTQTAAVVYKPDEHRISTSIKANNETILGFMREMQDTTEITEVAIEMVASYGMPVGRTVFDTCVWIGRFWQTAKEIWPEAPVRFITRNMVKNHVCHSSKATDANIRQALIDAFGGNPKTVVGTKKDPGPMYKMGNDERAALALAIAASKLEAVNDYVMGAQ